MKLDVHNLFLKDAIDEIMIKFDECEELGDYTLEIVHGHKHGTRIRDYIRSDGFLNDVTRNGYTITNKNFSDKGATIFQLKPSIKSLRKTHILKFESAKNKGEKPSQPIAGYHIELLIGIIGLSGALIVYSLKKKLK